MLVVFVGLENLENAHAYNVYEIFLHNALVPFA
jgi:hypothetical protein